jgi:lipoprotein-releasing system permease protein
MTFEWMVGLRYLMAKRKQAFISVITAISILGVAVGVMAMIVVLAVMSGFEHDLREKILGTNAHAVVLRYGGGIEEPFEVAKKAETVKGVSAATPFIFSQAMLTTDINVIGAVVRGVDVNTLDRVTNLKRYMNEGKLENLENPPSFIDKEDEPAVSLPGIVIGKELSKNIGAFYGDILTVVSPTGTLTPAGMGPKLKRFRVVGIFSSGMYEYDSSLAYISLGQAQTFFEMEGKVTGLELRVADIDEAHIVAADVRKVLGYPFYTRDWMDLNRNLFSALKLEKVVMSIILVLIILVAAFNIVSTLIMVVMEKGKDIAILKSMGATGKSIMRIFLIDGLVIGTVGTVLGLIAGYSLTWVLKTYDFIKLPADVYYITSLPVRTSVLDFVLVSGAAVVISLLATLYPAFRASRLNPVEAIRFE